MSECYDTLAIRSDFVLDFRYQVMIEPDIHSVRSFLGDYVAHSNQLVRLALDLLFQMGRNSTFQVVDRRVLLIDYPIAVYPPQDMSLNVVKSQTYSYCCLLYIIIMTCMSCSCGL